MIAGRVLVWAGRTSFSPDQPAAQFMRIPHSLLYLANIPRTVLALAALTCMSATAQIPPTPPAADAESKDAKPASQTTLDRVEVTGTASETEQRRASTASKIIIGKEDIERFGDSSVSEVLKRLPCVTTGGRPGRGAVCCRFLQAQERGHH